MSSTLVHVGATIMCSHAAQVSLTTGNTRVKVGGQFAIVLSDLGTVAGCPFTVGTTPSPCVTVRFLVPASRIRINGQPAVLQNTTGLGQNGAQVPQGPPNIVVTQMRVKGT